MRTEYLEFLVEISKTKSMSLAAKNLYMSPQGISSAITKLENELGVCLLNRTYNGVQLTEAGEKLVELTKTLLLEITEIKSEQIYNNLDTTDLTGTFSLYTAPLFCPMILPKVVAIFQKKYPKVRINIKEMDSYDVLQAVVRGEADVGLIMLIKRHIKTILGNLNIKDNVIIEELFCDHLYVQVGKSSPVSEKESVTLKEILQYPLAVFCHGKNIIGYLETFSYLYGKPRVAIESESKFPCKLSVEEGQTVAFMSGYAAKNLLLSDKVVTLPISDNVELLFGWVRTAQGELAPFLKDFINILKAHCEIND